MPDLLELEVATPERLLVKEQVSEVQIPAANGYLGLLPGHAPLLAQLATGCMHYTVDGQKRYLAIHGGFVEVNGGYVRVLADIAERAEEIDVERARRRMQRSQEEVVNPALGVGPAAALAAIARAQARLDASGRK